MGWVPVPGVVTPGLLFDHRRIRNSKLEIRNNIKIPKEKNHTAASAGDCSAPKR
jgi:hypothetical protein